MAGKFKGLALMGAVALHLSSTSAQAADPPSQEQAPPATSPQSVLQLSQADLEQLEKLGISTSQAEVDAELEEMQQNPEVYGPVDPRTLQRTVDQDMQQTLGERYAHTSEAYQAYMEELRNRYDRYGKNNGKVHIVLMENEERGTYARMYGAGFKFTKEF